MNFLRYVVLTVVCVAVAFAADAETDEDETADKTPTSDSTQAASSTSSDVVIPGQMMNILTQGGVVAAGIVALVAVAMVALPLFGIRICSLLNTCDTTPYHGYSNSVYNDYPANYNQGTFNSPTYQKRSIEYVAPVLQALSTAYDKYNRQTVVRAKQLNTPEQ